MFKKKGAKQSENPIIDELKASHSAIEQSITQFEALLKDLEHRKTRWYLKVRSAERLVAYRGLKSKKDAKSLLDIAVATYRQISQDITQTEEHLAKLRKSRQSVSDALLQVGTIAATTELQERLLRLTRQKTESEAIKAIEQDKSYEVNPNLQRTLFAVEALVSLRKEEVEK